MQYSFEKHLTGISGFDHIGYGGLPKGRSTLITGTSGSAKTVFVTQFLAEGIRHYDEAGVFVTFEESAEDIRRNMLGFGWDISQWEQAGKWIFVDASRQAEDDYVIGGHYDLAALLARIEYAVKSVNATRVSLDSVGALLGQFNDVGVVRHELFRIAAKLKNIGVTSLMTAERVHEDDRVTRFGVEEFVADNVIIMRNNLENERRRRTVEILKFRGAMHAKGEYPFTILPGKGIVVIPLSALQLTQPAFTERISMGNEELDKMSGGGLLRNSIILVAGATGSGKTQIASTFIAGGQSSDERCLLFAFEESRDQLLRNAAGWGVDLEQMERDGLLRIECAYPETAGLQDHLIRIQSIIEEYQPSRVAIDSLSALERVSNRASLQEFLVSLTAFLKHHQATALLTSATATLFGGTSITEDQTSTITDTIILMRYLETEAEMRRGLMILKMRGSNHDKRIREIKIDDQGIHVGSAFHSISGILSGNTSYMTSGETAIVRNMVSDHPSS